MVANTLAYFQYGMVFYTALSITTLSIMILSITTLSVTTLNIIYLFATLSINSTQHK
jgi:hypothetical protein